MENKTESVCPWWMGYLLLIPIRKLGHNPKKILAPHIKPGMTIMDYGSAMGYFSIPLAKMTGSSGVVYCVDIQQKMLEKLQSRALKHGVSDIVKPLLIGKNYNPEELSQKLDFILLFAVVHEVPDKKQLFTDLYKMAKPGAKILFAEPAGHVSVAAFEKSISIAQAAGFTLMEEKPMEKGLSAFFTRKG
jgi:2-polyprenyl-3-methyl-5-hydroxy-6-metoxy-1,4-benzoquinol methylase